MPEALPPIAIVDDDLPVLKALSRLLRGRGFDTRTYGSAQQFLDALPAASPACLIVDMQMPGMTGLELHQHLKQQGTQIPTIVITAHATDELQRRCLAEGAIAFFSKPLPIPSLLAAIETTRTI